MGARSRRGLNSSSTFGPFLPNYLRPLRVPTEELFFGNMRILNAWIALITLALNFAARTAFAQSTDTATPILWDPGLTHEGTRVISYTTDVATNVLFRITTANPSLGAWRTALTVLAGEANVYLSRGVAPTITSFDFKSDRAGS